MNFIPQLLSRAEREPEPSLSTEDLAGVADEPIDTRDDLTRFGDSMDRVLDQRLRRREWIAAEIAEHEARIADLQEQDRQNTVIIEQAERCVREARDQAADPDAIVTRHHDIRVRGAAADEEAERSREEHMSARHDPEQEAETA